MTDYARGPMTPKIALDLAIFGVNTFMHPDASTETDIGIFEARAEEVVAELSNLRTQLGLGRYVLLTEDEADALDQWRERQAELAADGEYTPEEAARLTRLMEGG